MGVDRVHFGGRSSALQGFFPAGRPRTPAVVGKNSSLHSAQAKPAPHVAKLVAAAGPQRVAAPSAPQLPGPQKPMQAFGASQVFEVPSNIDLSGRGGGQGMAQPVRQKMESFFNADFSDVRIHIGHQASAIGAIAFTHGSNIFFAQGRYNPDTPQGQQLLGHELTHVLQQRAGRVRNPLGSGVAVVQDPGLEAEAERMGLRVAAMPEPAQAKPEAGAVSTALAPSGWTPSPQTPSVQAKGPSGFWVSQLPMTSGRRRLTVHRGGQSLGQADVHPDGPNTAHVYNLKVDPAFRGQGAGAALLREAARAGASMGKNRLALDSEDNGSGKLTSWYRREGFQRVGTNDRGMAVLEAPAQALMHKP